MKRDYELGIIFNPEASEEETRAILNRLEQIVTTFDGQTVRVQQWGRRRLAYLIERHRDGFYVFLDLILTPETVSELDRTLKVSEIVLRYMFKRRDPKAIQQEREARTAAAANAPTTEATGENQQTSEASETPETQETFEAPETPAETTSTEAEPEQEQVAPEVPTETSSEVPPAPEEEAVQA